MLEKKVSETSVHEFKESEGERLRDSINIKIDTNQAESDGGVNPFE